jgi:hypothetical protein
MASQGPGSRITSGHCTASSVHKEPGGGIPEDLSSSMGAVDDTFCSFELQVALLRKRKGESCAQESIEPELRRE